MNDIIIREYNSDDYDKLLEILMLNIPEYFSQEEYPDFQKYLKEERENYFVAENDDMIVGCGGINYKKDENIAMISWDIIHPKYQGNGIGNRILNHRIDLIKKHHPNYKIIIRTSQLVYKFYEKNGFILLERHKDFWAEGFDMYKMEYQ